MNLTKRSAVSKVFSIAFFGAFFGAVFATVGCSKTPDKVCAHFDSVDKSERAEKRSPEDKKKSTDRCISDLTSMKADYPSTFDCVSKCTKFDTEQATKLCAVECIGKDPKYKADAEAKSKKEMEDSEAKRVAEDKKKADWAGRSMASTPVRTGGVSFSINVPEGIKKDESESFASFRDDGFSYPAPSVMVRVSDYKLLDYGFAEKMATAGNKTIAKKEKLDDGYMFVTHGPDKESLTVTVSRNLGKKKSIECQVSQTGVKGGIPKFGDQASAFEKVCTSLKAL